MRRLCDLRAAILVLVGVTAFAPTASASIVAGESVDAAAARAKPTVSLTFAGGTREGARIPFTWTAKRLGRGARLVVQRPVGTSKVWRTMRRLTGSGGSGTLPGVSLGRYRYRLTAIRDRKVLAQQVAWVSVYGPVPFSKLFNHSTEVYLTPTASFPYMWSFTAGATSYSVLQNGNNRCLAVHVDFVTQSESDAIVVSVVQEARDPVSASAAADSIASLDADLTPGQTWGITAQANAGADTGNSAWANLFINGSAICDSRKPVA